jgi:UDP-N-acetyl-alpha-D-muramoyl-L-alanyl-L-glutamate epimerase
MTRVLRLDNIQIGPECIAVSCALDDLPFHFTTWYEDLDLLALAGNYGRELIERLAFHVALFQINAVGSLRPDVLELGRYARFATPRLVALWRTVFRNVWAQWRWENDQPDYLGPSFADAPATAPPPAPVSTPVGPVELLAYCGGGKDSLVALKLLERGGLPFATLGYAHSIYGDATHQHALLDRLAERSSRVRAERQWMLDDFLGAPAHRLRPSLGVRTLTAAETPASVFAALPLALARGYHGLVLAHEHSANAGNLTWAATGEDVNHQWGKSWEAERMLDAYVRSELLADVRYYSVLQPIHDEVIFELLARDAELAPLTHSCNLEKPWCGRCAKCAYVWLQMAAHLPPALVDATFGADLGEEPANERWFRQLLGLAEHTPFECVGSAPESRLALALAARRRPLGPRLAAVAAEVGPVDVPAIARDLVGVDAQHGMPDHVAAVIMPQLHDAAAAARRRLGC